MIQGKPTVLYFNTQAECRDDSRNQNPHIHDFVWLTKIDDNGEAGSRITKFRVDLAGTPPGAPPS